MTESKLDLKVTLSDGIPLGIKNVPSLIGAVLLYVVTAWIPYLNVGTTVGMYRIVIGIKDGKVINPLSIFDRENFKDIGNLFLFLGLKNMGIGAAAVFMFFPAVVISIAWEFAVYLMIEKHTSPLESLTLSYKATNGEKRTVFLVELLYWAAIGVVSAIFGLIKNTLGSILVVLLMIFASTVFLSIKAMMYRHFSAKADRILAAEAAAIVAAGIPSGTSPEAE